MTSAVVDSAQKLEGAASVLKMLEDKPKPQSHNSDLATPARAGLMPPHARRERPGAQGREKPSA